MVHTKTNEYTAQITLAESKLLAYSAVFRLPKNA